jgi:hypothetical protein
VYAAGSVKVETISDTEAEDSPVAFAFIPVKREPDNALDEFRTLRDEGRPVTCGVHNKSFSENFPLNTHKRIDTGER